MVLDRHHIILYVIAGALALGGVYLIESRVADKAQSKADAAVAQAQLLQQQNAAFQTQVQAQLTSLANQNALLAVQNAQLTSAISARDAAVKQSVAAIPAMSQDAVASGIQNGLALAPSDIQATPSGSYTVSRPGANAILGSIQREVALSADLQDATSQVTNLNAALKNDGQELTLEKQSHASDLSACQADIKASKAETKAAVAKGRRNWFKGFFVGVVTGFVGARAI